MLTVSSCWHLFKMNFIQVEKDKTSSKENSSLQSSVVIPAPEALEYIHSSHDPVSEVTESEIAAHMESGGQMEKQ